MPLKRKNKSNSITDLLLGHINQQRYTPNRVHKAEIVNMNDFINIRNPGYENYEKIKHKPESKFDWKTAYDLARAYGANQFYNENVKLDEIEVKTLNDMNKNINTKNIEDKYIPIITTGTIENTLNFLEPVKDRDSIGTITRFNTPTAKSEIARQYGIDGIKSGVQNFEVVEKYLHRVPDKSMNNIVYINPPGIVQQSTITVPQIAVDVINQDRPAYPFFIGLNDNMHPGLQGPERQVMKD